MSFIPLPARDALQMLEDDGVTIECLECTHVFKTTEEVFKMCVFCPKCSKTNNARVTVD